MKQLTDMEHHAKRNFIIVSFGSKGDINPFIYIGKTLVARGYKVTIVTNGVHETEIKQSGIDFYQVGTKLEYEKVIQSAAMFHAQKAFGFSMKNIVIKNMRASFSAIQELYDNETIVISPSVAPAGRIAHEILKIPLITINLQPMPFWSVYAPPVLSGLTFVAKIPFRLRKAVLNLIERFVIDQQAAPEINKFLKELGLPAQKHFSSRWLYSPQLVLGLFPEWFAPPAKDWVDNVKLVGFIKVTNREQIPAPIEEFLSKGEQPVLFTAGTAMKHANHFFKVANQTVIQENKRAIFVCSKENLNGIILGKNILAVDYVSFDELFSKISLVVHHGGIGTIIPAILAATPQIIVPNAYDQPDNADRIEKLGLGVTILPQKFTVSHLSEKMKLILNAKTFKNNCQQYSKKVDLNKSLNDLMRIIEEFETEIK